MANVFTYQNEEYHVGDTVSVHMNVSEGDKNRIQVFDGLIIKVRGARENKSFTLRKIGANGIGVERILPVMCPTIAQIDKKAEGQVRRAKLNYLRQRVGRRALKVKTKDTTSNEAKAKIAAKAEAKAAKVKADAKKETTPKAAAKKTTKTTKAKKAKAKKG